jgi:HSP20 family protein
MLPMLRKTQASVPSFIDEFFGKDWMDSVFSDRPGISTPAVNVKETNDDFMIEVAAPGLDKKDFKVDIDNNMLTISSEKEFKNEEKDEGRYMRREFSYTSFSRSFSLPDAVDAEKINAKHKDGILMITIPKKDEAKRKPPKQIQIS